MTYALTETPGKGWVCDVDGHQAYYFDTEAEAAQYGADVQGATARIDAYATSPETKARLAANADSLAAMLPATARDTSGNSVATVVAALRRAAQ